MSLGDPAFWRSFYQRKQGNTFEWFVSATAAARALAPRLPRAGRILHLGCGTSRLGPLLAARGFDVTNVDYDESCLVAARTHAAPLAAEWAAVGGACEWVRHDMRELPSSWTSRFDAVVDKGGLCAAVFAGEAHAAAACREAARCCTPKAQMHWLTDDPPEQRVELLRAALPDFDVVGTLIELEADAEDGEESDLSSHEREYYVYSARRRV